MDTRADDLLEIRTLGGLTFECSGQPIAGIVSRKVNALLVYLACTKRMYPREVLAEMLWAERSQGQSLANLRTVLTTVRQKFGPYVLISRDEVGINPASNYWLDVAAMEEHLAAADSCPALTGRLSPEALQAMEAAVELHRGDFLEGFYLDSPAFEAWALLQRQQLRFKVMEALDRLIAEYLACGAYTAGVAHSTRLLQMDNLREKTHLQLMQLLAASGQREAALSQYALCRRLLREELDIEPAPETVAFQEMILAGTLTPAPCQPARSAPRGRAVAPTNPYKGLRAFQEADAEDFFGREALVRRLLARMEGADPQARFLAVVGPSGCGKSSAVRAGLLPALRDGALPGSDHWLTATLMPGPRPLDELAVALRRALSLGEVDILGELAGDPGGLLRVVRQSLPEDSRVELVLLIDQFEELYSLVREEGVRRHFSDSLLAALADPHSRLRVVITLRADFYDRPLLYPALGDWVRQCTEVVLPLSPKELERAIAGPAERVSVQVEPALIAAIVADVNAQPGALPLLQYALTELFECRDSDRLTLAAYRASGGVQGAVATRAEGLYAVLDPAEQQAVRQVFLRLVQLGEGTKDTRRRVPWAEVVAVAGGETSAHAVTDRFARHRLLTLDYDPATGGRTVELAHEALIREWHRLHVWIDECRADLRQQRLLSAAAADWLQAGEDRSYLLTGSRLAQFEDWVATTTVVLTPDERRHLDASIAEHRRQRTRRRRARRATLAAAMAIALVMAVLSLLALDREREARAARARAEREAAVSHSTVLGQQAQAAQAAGYTDLALALALEAAAIEQPPSDIVGVLADIAFGEGTRYTIQAHDYSVKDVAMSPDELFGLSGSCLTMDNSVCVKGALILWDLSVGTEVRRFEGHLGWVNSVAFSPDGEAVLSGSADKTVVLWDVSTGEIIRRFEGHTSAVNGVAFGPDGQAVLSGSADMTLILWDATTGAVTRRLEGHTDAVNSVAFSSDGSLVFSGDEGSWLRVYDARSGEEYRDRPHTYGQAVTDVSISRSGRAVISTIGSCLLFDTRALTDLRRYGGDYLRNIWTAAIGPSGRVALVGTTDGLLGLLNLESHAQIRRFGVGVPYFGLAISPDGDYLLTGNVAQQHGEATLWDLATGTEVRRLKIGNSTSIFDVAFSPDGRYAFLAVSNLMGDPDAPSRIVLWDIETGEEVPRFEDELAGWTLSIAVSPDGRQLLSSSASMAPDRVQGGLLLWDVETGRLIRQFTTVNTGSVVFSADGSRALSGTYWGSDGHVSLWDVTTGQEIRRFERGHFPGDAAFGVAFGPGETTIISGSSDSILVVWDVATGRILRRFIGHDGAVWSRIRVSKDGRYVLSGSYGDVILWDFETGGILHHFRGYTNWGNVVFGPEERTVFAASGSASDGVIEWKIADLPLDELIEWTYANRFVRELTCSEREQYRVEPPCQ